MLNRHLKYLAFLTLLARLVYACGCTKQEIEKLNIPINAVAVAEGEQLFVSNCSACHNFRKRAIDPNPSGVTEQLETV